MTIIRLLSLVLIMMPAILQAQKIPLDHEVYDGWKSISSPIISDNGKWVIYEINTQQGDGWLYICNITTGRKDSVFCAARASLSPDAEYIVYQIRPTYAETRKAKKEKMKEEMMPKNNLGIRVLQENKEQMLIKKVRSFSVPESGSMWMAYLLEKKSDNKKESKSPPDSSSVVKSPGTKGKKPPEPKGTELVVLNPLINKEYRYDDVTEFVVSQEGKTISFIQDYPDTSKTDNFKVSVFDTQKETSAIVFEGKGSAKKLNANKAGNQLSFMYSGDTSKTRVYDLYLSRGSETATKVIDASNAAMPSGFCVSENGIISFSDDGTRLYFGTADKPVTEPEDTLLSEEKYKLDIWSWDDQVLQPMQKKQIDQDLKRSYQAVYHIDRKVMFQLADKDLPSIRTLQKGNNDIALGSSNLKYRKESSWESDNSTDYYTVNVETGLKTKVLEKFDSRVSISPSGKFLVYWDINDRVWVSLSVSTGVNKVISSGIKVPLYDELTDIPSEPAPYGIEGWMEDEKHVLVRDRYDIWQLDLSGTENPVNITNGYGKRNHLSFQYQKLDNEADFIGKKELMFLTAFNNYTKEAGFFTIRAGTIADPSKIEMGKWAYSRGLMKAKKADKLIWQKGTFEQSPELYISDMALRDSQKLSITNPQQSKYIWGTVDLVEWMSFDRQKLQGLLYKPENFDPAKKYPMIVYFYERSSDGLYNYNPPAPSASIINRTFAVSNGYLVFVPDIPYIIGYPGQSCYNAVVSGTYSLLERYSYIDRERLGLDGQSWGGYQIAYLVTQTDLFKCAYAGAAVSNMISAYGGIRWGTGMSRMFQYEHTQSRIGGTLWDKPLQFIENSPIFWVPKINTPLLLMHNDADDAVPWYQSIEFITALRRLDKPAWLLSYNDENHNLVKRSNRKDISIRKMQFFDHYLKGALMPYWMKNGISQLEKGKRDGYELVKD
jgi:dipeptidyl aminopeptidase/acylaminoacyl peptidase